MIRTIIKRNGTKEPYIAEKINGWGIWASENLKGVDWSEVVLNTVSSLPFEVTSTELQKALIDYCLSKKTWDYNRMAGRLYTALIVREIHGSDQYPTVKELHQRMQEYGLMEKLDYSDEEYEQIEKIIKHKNNLKLPQYALNQNRWKYALRDKVNGVEFETTQFIYMRMAMTICEETDKSKRMQEIEELYDEFTNQRINVPTPYYVNLGTKLKGYASCCVYSTLDTAKSLGTGDHIGYMMTVASAGIGYHLKTRSIGDPIKNGLIRHQGKVPYIRASIGAVGANTQNCYAVGTKVLTDKGFVDFRDVTADTVIAQVENDGTISYTNPLDVIKHHYNGKMISFSLNNPKKRNNEKLLVTPNHRMVYHKNIHCKGGNRKKELISLGYCKTDKNYYHSSEYFVDSASDIATNRSVLFDFGANAIGEKSLTDFDRLCIAYQTDGSTRYVGNFAYTFHFSKKRKVQRLTQLLENCGIEYTLSITKNNTFNIYAKIGKKMYKDFKHFDLTEKSKQWCLDFLNELQYWDGGKCDTKNVDTFSYLTINYENIEFVQAVASMCSVYTSISIGNIGKENHQPLYEIYINPNKHNTTLRTYTKTYVDYDDFVYCVTVPTGRIIVKYNDNTFVCGNSRGGSTTVHVNAYDPEIETLMKLKNPNTPLAKQARGADYSVGFNGFFIKKAIANQDIALFSYKDAPKLYELMYSDDTKAFEKEYQKFIDSDLPRTMVSARKIVGDMLAESFDTGRVYEHFTDTINTHTPFKDKIYQSNLCAEITLPTYGFTDVPQLYSEHDESLNFTKIVTEKGEFLLNNYIYVKLADGTEKLSQRLYDGDETVEYGTVQSIETSHSPEIGLCNIGGIVVSNIKNDEQYAKTAYWVLRLIRYGILNSEYVFKNLEQTAKARMSAGVGIVGLAHLMAKNKLSYSSQEGKNFIHELAETHAWHLYNASLKIGQEFGNAEWMYKTKWVDGWTPIKTYNKNVDKLVTVGNKRDWDDLSRRIVENNGMAFSVCVAHMPAESCMDIDTKIKTENGIMSLKEIFALTGRDIEKELLEMNRSMDGGKWFKLDKPINVYTLAGLKPLTDVWLNGVTNYIEIELENGDVMRVTHHHKFLVRDGNGKTSWKMAIDLTENDDIVNVNEPLEQVA